MLAFLTTSCYYLLISKSLKYILHFYFSPAPCSILRMQPSLICVITCMDKAFPTAVLVADVNPMFCKGMKESLRQKTFVDCTASMEKVMRFIAEHAHPYLLLSYRLVLKNKDCLDIIFKQAHAKVLLITANYEPEHLRYLVSLPAAGVIDYDSDGNDIEAALQHIAKHNTHYYSPVIASIVAGMQHPETTFSERQQQVFELMLEGLPNKLIADKVGLRLSTVQVHRKCIKKKIKEAGFTHELPFAYAMGILVRRKVW